MFNEGCHEPCTGYKYQHLKETARREGGKSASEFTIKNDNRKLGNQKQRPGYFQCMMDSSKSVVKVEVTSLIRTKKMGVYCVLSDRSMLKIMNSNGGCPKEK